MIAPARVAACDVLMAVSSGSADLAQAIAQARATLPDERDRALASEIATGVQRWRAALDHIIVQLARRTLDRLDGEVVDILRLSLYQLRHLSRVPARAVVDDAVKLTRRAGKRSAGPFVNAVLRSFLRLQPQVRLPARPVRPDDRDGWLDYFSVTMSHPRWLVARWHDRLGPDVTEEWLRFNNAAAPLTLRANRLRSSREQLQARLASQEVMVRPGRFAPDSLIVEDGRPAGDDFVIQDEASQLVTLLAGASPGRWVLDPCASPGGKATAIAATMTRLDGASRLVACDVRSRRMQLLERTVRSSGTPGIFLVQADLLRPLPFSRTFDCVIVDAPCSGLGTLRRDPDIKWRRREADLGPLAAAQRTMLRHAAAAVAAGGRLVYATCSSEPEENEAIVEDFLGAVPVFRMHIAGSAHPQLPAAVVDERGFLRTSPDAHGLECFFGAVFERINSGPGPRI